MNPPPKSDALTAVLPLRIQAQAAGADLYRLKNFLMPSFEKYWQGVDDLEFLIIAPSSDVKIIQEALSEKTKFPLKVVSEDTICPTIIGRFGWHKQQVIKLAAARIVRTSAYLTLDADIVLTKPMSVARLFPNGKPVFQHILASHHWNWWLASAGLLDIRDSIIDKTSEVMDVTPAILFSELALGLLQRLAEKSPNQDADSYLMDNTKMGWTEYSLYWLFALDTDQTKLYSDDKVSMYGGIWNLKESSDLNPEFVSRFFTEAEAAYFLVIQSNLELPLKQIKQVLAPHLAAVKATEPWFDKIVRLLGRP